MNNIRSGNIFLCCTFIFLFECAAGFSQSSEKNRIDTMLQGAIDFHVHSSPDVSPRILNDFEVAEQAQKKGMKAIVIKSHVSSTAGRAVLVNIKTPKIRVFGGVVLNKAVGGINPDAVEAMYKMSPDYGKVVWFPTIDAAYNKDKNNPAADGLTILLDDKLSPQTIQVLKIIARENLVLATGHLSPKEILLMVPEAKKLGVNKILITHAMGKVPGLSITQMNELVREGAIMELTYLSVIPGGNATGNLKRLTIEDMVKAIKQIGAKNFLISSDMGQPANPAPVEGMEIFVKKFLEKGISPDEIKLMIKTNPAKLLGIE